MRSEESWALAPFQNAPEASLPALPALVKTALSRTVIVSSTTEKSAIRSRLAVLLGRVSKTQNVPARSALEDVVAAASCQPVRALEAIETIRPAPALEAVGNRIPGDGVVTGTADDVLDQRLRVPVVEQRIRDIARCKMPVAQIGALRGAGGVERAPSSGLQIDRQVRRVGGQVVGVDAVAVPDCHENLVAGHRPHAHAVDESLAGRRIPGIDRIAAVGVEICAVEILQGRNIMHHEGLRDSPEFRSHCSPSDPT